MTATGLWRDAPVAELPLDTTWTGIDVGVRDRIARVLGAADRAAMLAARTLTASLVAQMLGVEPPAVGLFQRCSRCGGGDHGQPAVVGEPGLHISWSHTRWHVAAAVASDPVAIDVESVLDVSPGVRRRVLSADEELWLDRTADRAAFARLWSRKECAVKLGWTTLDDLARTSFCVDGTLAATVRGMRVLERSGPCRSLVAVTSGEVEWLPIAPRRAST